MSFTLITFQKILPYMEKLLSRLYMTSVMPPMLLMETEIHNMRLGPALTLPLKRTPGGEWTCLTRTSSPQSPSQTEILSMRGSMGLIFASETIQRTMALTTHCKIIQASLSVKQHLNDDEKCVMFSLFSSLLPPSISLFFRAGVINFIPAGRSLTFRWDKGVEGRYVTVVLPGTGRNLTLCEVEVYGYLAPTGKYVKHANVSVLSNCEVQLHYFTWINTLSVTMLPPLGHTTLSQGASNSSDIFMPPKVCHRVVTVQELI